jgi:hypothetical protein
MEAAQVPDSTPRGQGARPPPFMVASQSASVTLFIRHLSKMTGETFR